MLLQTPIVKTLLEALPANGRSSRSCEVRREFRLWRLTDERGKTTSCRQERIADREPVLLKRTAGLLSHRVSRPCCRRLPPKSRRTCHLERTPLRLHRSDRRSPAPALR